MLTDILQIFPVLWSEARKVLDAIYPVVGYAALAYFATRFTLAIAQAIVRTTKTLDNEARRAELRAEAAVKAQAELLERQRAQQEALENAPKLLDESSDDDLEDTPAGTSRQQRQQARAN
ncbi:MAG: hypothetical protein O2807_13115 [bacterium]|nr:hypothetical protein [bacterium]